MRSTRLTDAALLQLQPPQQLQQLDCRDSLVTADGCVELAQRFGLQALGSVVFPPNEPWRPL